MNIVDGNSFVFTIFLIFSGAAVLATFALFARQALIVAYIFLGVLLGPWVTGLVDNPDLIGQFAHVGIMFLLFLLGLNLDQPLGNGVKFISVFPQHALGDIEGFAD